MNQRRYRGLLVLLLLLGIFAGTGLCIDKYHEENKLVSTKTLDNNMVLPGGMPIGIYMEIDGILVLGTEEIEDVNGEKCEPAKKVIQQGDYILKINGTSVDNKNELIREINGLKKEEVVLGLRRENEYVEVIFEAVEVQEQEFKLGIWVRDSIQGLGTVTYMTSESEFGALGHGIHDVDTETLVQMREGRVYDIDIVGIQKGEKGNPGGMEGIIIYNRQNILGNIYKNSDNGIYGQLKAGEKLFVEQEPVEICEKREIELGEAVIQCTVDGEIEQYDIEIKSIDYFSRDENKGLVIEVVDEELIERTGGIVQGMSGSPIIQDGKLVGAVTHVLVNDPTRGYGIFIENMLDAAS